MLNIMVIYKYVTGDNLNFLNKSVEKMENDRPDYIFFVWDLIDDSKYSTEELQKLYDYNV